MYHRNYPWQRRTGQRSTRYRCSLGIVDTGHFRSRCASYWYSGDDETQPWWCVVFVHVPSSSYVTDLYSVGVVNAQLKIFDTANVRVVDASIMPLQISAHLSATLYGVAEKAADLIKASY